MTNEKKERSITQCVGIHFTFIPMLIALKLLFF